MRTLLLALVLLASLVGCQSQILLPTPPATVRGRFAIATTHAVDIHYEIVAQDVTGEHCTLTDLPNDPPPLTRIMNELFAAHPPANAMTNTEFLINGVCWEIRGTLVHVPATN